MKPSNSNTTAVAKTANRKLTRTDKDSKWKSFPKVPGLMQYTPSQMFFARVKVRNDRGKKIVTRHSLETDVFTTAKVRLPLKVVEIRKPKPIAGTFGDGRLRYEAESNNGYTSKKRRFITLAPLSIAYRLRCLECLRRTLVEVLFHPDKTWKSLSDQEQQSGFAKLDAMNAREFTAKVCEAWQTVYAEYAPSVFNNTVNTFRRVLELAGLPHDDSPAYKIGRRDIVGKPIRLPRPEQFDRIISLVETSGAAQAKDCANLIRFLTFTGARISEAKQAIWSDVDWQENTLQIHSVKVRGSHDGQVTRIIPLNPALQQFLEQLRFEEKPQPNNRICKVSECQKSLDRACKLVNCKRLTHHDLRHYFVTKCLQAGVDVFTLAKWVGHKDNGKLLLKVYSHLQAEHSQEQAAKVKFGAAPLPKNVTPLPQAAIATAN